ncbi:NAD(P)H-dependent oxidoreductase [Lentzea sp. BCCO 10_0856]|uniref:NAD(P)H-dependent oxidoreductase n=1 Tax=Lentzea miocenica TaxID=3095431 RepID=A0ABU4TBN0_9PSEU|nr:NAD(P)H-dependent oxidoreductase [Lentzea sp. BCCO 10_0856]MDX8035584.1 NAD(P)H-dependent oxidoreductase [Lentzea sp. BCCO 10_0856]
MRIAVILGSTRPGRRSEAVAQWVVNVANARDDASFDLVDLAEFDLPMLDEPMPAIVGQYQHAHTREWASRIASYDGFVFVTPEYNHSFSAALKNAIDYLYAEWNDKAAGFVGIGGTGGLRAVEQLRLVLAELKVATVRTQVAFARGDLQGEPQHHDTLNVMLDELVAWASALRSVRSVAA